MAVAVAIGLVFYSRSPTMQAWISKQARESGLVCCRGLSPLAAKPCEVVPWPFLLLIDLSTLLLAARFRSLLAWTAYRCSS